MYSTRAIPSTLLNKWGAGSFSTIADSVNYHFATHAGRMGIKDIVSYINAADSMRLQFTSTSQGTHVQGATPNVYRYRANGLFVDVAGTNPKTGILISFGY